MKQHRNILILALVALLGWTTSCQEDYYFDGGISSGELGVSTYDFLASRPKSFDTLLWVIDYHDLKGLVNQENSTFFAPQDDAFDQFFDKLEMDPVPNSLEELPVAVKDTLGLLLRKYSIAQKVMREDVPTDSKLELSNANNEPVGVFFINNPRGGVPGYGPKILAYSAVVKVKSSINDEIVEQERFAGISTSNLESTNGAVHVVENGHTFGF